MKRQVAFYSINEPKFVHESQPLIEIMEQMDKNKLSHILVKNKKNKLSGIISKNDLLQKLNSIANQTSGKSYTAFNMKSVTAKEIMTKDPICIQKEDDIAYAVELLLQRKFHALPVIEDEKPVGIVTFYDLLKGYYQAFG